MTEGVMEKVKNGYIYVKAKHHPNASRGKVAEHILVIEELIGEVIPKGFKNARYEIHHINRRRKDNRPENLLLTEKGQHGRIHKAIERDDPFAEQRVIAECRTMMNDIIAGKESLYEVGKKVVPRDWNRDCSIPEYQLRQDWIQEVISGFSIDYHSLNLKEKRVMHKRAGERWKVRGEYDEEAFLIELF